MADPSRFPPNSKKTSFLFSSFDNNASLDDLKFSPSFNPIGAHLSNHSSPLHSPLPHLPPSSPQQRMMQTSFQPFDPFNTAVTLDTNKDDTTDLDELSNLLSRQFLEDVDAETLPITSPSARPSPVGNYYAPSHSPNTSHAPLTNPWRVDDGGSKKPWSPAVESTSLLPSLFTRRHEESSKSAQQQSGWKRFEPYGNDSEFDPTLQFYPGLVDSPTATPLEVETVKQAPVNMTLKAALQKLSTLFKDHDEKKLGQTLACYDYDVERTIQALLVSSSTTEAEPIIAPTPTPVVKASSPSPPPTKPVPVGSPKKRQVCRHYLAGECYRKDCWFAHDLEVKPCKFWLQGSCLKGDTCEFAHSLEEIDQVVQYHHQPALDSPSDHQQDLYQEKIYIPTVVDFPILVARSNRKSKKSNKKAFKK